MAETDMVTKLNSIVEELGEIYLGMSDKYPRFLEKLEQEFSCYSKEDNGKDGLAAVSENVNRFLEKKNDFSRENSDREKELIDTIDRELQKLRRIEDGIAGMEECSEDLELISLNAMVSALKAGNNGGAFPYITRELQRVSRLSRENSNSIRMFGRNLDREYSTLIERVRTSQKDTGENIGGIYDALEGVISGLSFYDKSFKELCEILENTVNKMRSPLYMIVEEVQKHDIVRQSVNHIIISLDEINDFTEEGEGDERLNYLKFACQVYELSRFIIDDIRESVHRSYERFSSEKQGVEDIIESLGREMGQKVSEIGRDDFEKRIESISRSVSQYFLSHNDNLSHSELRTEHFNDLIDDLEAGIDQYGKVLSSIRNIHVASRIEVVKLKKLENMDNIIANIDITVGEMEDQLAQIDEAVDEFRKASGVIVSDFIEYSMLVQAQMQDSMTNLEPVLNAVRHFQVNLKEHFYQFEQVNREFKGFTGLVDDHLNHMSRLIGDIDFIRDTFESKRVGYATELEEELEAAGYSDWSLEGDRIKKLIDKFTIFIHKKVMTGVEEKGHIGLDEEQAGASEITLF